MWVVGGEGSLSFTIRLPLGFRGFSTKGYWGPNRSFLRVTKGYYGLLGERNAHLSRTICNKFFLTDCSCDPKHAATAPTGAHNWQATPQFITDLVSNDHPCRHSQSKFLLMAHGSKFHGHVSFGFIAKCSCQHHLNTT